jgi:hypothetical protein
MPSPMLIFRLPADDDAQVRELARRKGMTVSAELHAAPSERSSRP